MKLCSLKEECQNHEGAYTCCDSAFFTPDWIVRYMVENSLGRLWLEGHPNEELKSNWKYYLDEVEQEDEVGKKI